jgi:DNA adenine methylase
MIEAKFTAAQRIGIDQEVDGMENVFVDSRAVGTQLRTDRVINVSAVPHRSPFRYPGGKTWLVPHIRNWLRSLSQKPHEFVEPFAGGAIVGLSVLFEGLTDRLALVELDEDVGAVWNVILRGDGNKLAGRITSFDLTLRSVKSILATEPASLLDRAFATIVRNRVQRGGIMAPGASLMKQGENGRGLKSRWYAETLRRRIEAISAARHRINFICGDGLEFIRYHAYRPDAVFFIDPPYTVAGRRLYKYPHIDHEKLFRIVGNVKSDFLMSYDNAPEITKLAAGMGFDVQEVAMKNTHHQVVRELLIGRCLDWARTSVISRESSPQISLSLAASQL